MKAEGYNGTYVLLDEEGIPIEVGDEVEGFIIKGGYAPHKPSSTGRVWTSTGDYFPTVINAHWQLQD